MRPHRHLHRLLGTVALGVLLVLPAAPGWATNDPSGHEHATGTEPTAEPSAPGDGDEMAGMDMSGTGTGDTGDEGAHDMDEMAGMDHGGSTPSVHDSSATDGSTTRSRALVISTFVGVNAAVLIAAARRRRHDRLHPRPRPRRSPAPA